MNRFPKHVGSFINKSLEHDEEICPTWVERAITKASKSAIKFMAKVRKAISNGIYQEK